MTGRPADPGLDADLATRDNLRDALNGRFVGGDVAWAILNRWDTMEAELARLRERNAAKSAMKFCPYCAGAFVPETAGYEGPCAGCKRAEAADARCARLRQALGELRSALARERGGGTPLSRSEYIELHRSSGELLHRREALAGPDTPADTRRGDLIERVNRAAAAFDREVPADSQPERGGNG